MPFSKPLCLTGRWLLRDCLDFHNSAAVTSFILKLRFENPFQKDLGIGYYALHNSGFLHCLREKSTFSPERLNSKQAL